MISTSEPDSNTSSRQNNYHPIEANGSKGRNNWNFVLSDLVLNISPILFHECKYCTIQLERTVHPIESYSYLYFYFSESYNIAFSTGHLLRWDDNYSADYLCLCLSLSLMLISNEQIDVDTIIILFFQENNRR